MAVDCSKKYAFMRARCSIVMVYTDGCTTLPLVYTFSAARTRREGAKNDEGAAKSAAAAGREWEGKRVRVSVMPNNNWLVCIIRISASRPAAGNRREGPRRRRCTVCGVARGCACGRHGFDSLFERFPALINNDGESA